MTEPIRTVTVTGASGLIGSQLVAALEADGVAVRRLTRGEPRRPGEFRWDPAAGRVDPAAFAGADAVVHLAGEPIGVRWTAEGKRRMRESRVRGTELVARTIAALEEKPRVFASGSAVGIYGNRRDEVLDETSRTGDDFLADVGRAWEGATAAASDAGIRVVHMRTGIVLSRRGGALERMLLPFRMGVGGRLGSGRQWMSWIALDDEVRAIRHLLDRDDLAGPFNLVGPAPATNAELTAALGSVLGRPAVLPVPAFALRTLFGEMADAAILASQRVLPKRLVSSGFEFRYPDLASALRREIATA